MVDVDLAAVALPFLDEPHHPKLGHYVHKHTKQWSATAYLDGPRPDPSRGVPHRQGAGRFRSDARDRLRGLRDLPRRCGPVCFPPLIIVALMSLNVITESTAPARGVCCRAPGENACANTRRSTLAPSRVGASPRTPASATGCAPPAAAGTRCTWRDTRDFRGGADDHVPASASPGAQETEPEELKENEPVTAQQGLSQRPQSPQPGDNQSPHLILGWG